MFGGGLYSGNIIQGGSVLQPQDYALSSKLTLTPGMISGSNLSSAANAVDGSIVTSDAGYLSSVGTYVAIDYGSAVVATKFRIYFPSIGSPVGTLYMQYSDDGSTWVDTDATPQMVSTAGWKEFTWTSVGARRHWRLYVKAPEGGGGPWYREIELYTSAIIPNCIVVTEAASVAPDLSVLGGAALVQNLVVDGASAVLALSSVAHGLALLASGSVMLVNGGKINVDSKALAGFVQADCMTLAAPPLRGKVSPRHHAFAQQRNALALDGGMLFLAAPSVSIASGCIVSADGTAGNQNGGVVSIIYRDTYSNLGTVRANGYGAGAAGVVSINKV
jgi:hypothetical protein